MIFLQSEVDDVLRWIGKSDEWFAENDHIERRNYAISRLARTLIQDRLLEDGLIIKMAVCSPHNKAHLVTVDDPRHTTQESVAFMNGCHNMAWLGAAVEYRKNQRTPQGVADDERCTKCREVRDLTLFVNDKRRPGGKGSWCRECQSKAEQAWADRNRAKRREHCKEYVKKHFARRKATLEGYAERHREKKLAQGAVRKAIRAGTLVPEPCFCGATEVEAHHPDYTKPLEVFWRCAKHHRPIYHRAIPLMGAPDGERTGV